MPATVTRMDHRPVVVTTFYEPADAQTVQMAYQRAIDLSARMGGQAFWIVDLRGADDSFVEVAELWMDITAEKQQTGEAPSMCAYIGLPAMSDYFAEVGLPFFHEVYEALAAQHVHYPLAALGA